MFIAQSKGQCEHDLDDFILMCNYVGISSVPEKTVGPATVLQFAGTTLDSVRQEARLPEDKLQKCRAMLQNIQAQCSVCLKELQSLIVLLNCLVVVPGRAFLRRMIDLTKGVNKPHHHIRLSRGAKLDIMLSLRFLDDFNGRSFSLSVVWETSQSLQLYTDATGSIGFGAVFDRHWLHGTWPNLLKSYNIALLELFPTVIDG